MASARQLSSVPRTVSDFLGGGRGGWSTTSISNWYIIWIENNLVLKLTWAQPASLQHCLAASPAILGWSTILHIKWNKVLSAQKPPWPQLISSYTFQPNPISSRTKTPKRAHTFAPPPMNIFEPYPLVPRDRVVLTSLASSATETICPRNYSESTLFYIDFQLLMSNLPPGVGSPSFLWPISWSHANARAAPEPEIENILRSWKS